MIIAKRKLTSEEAVTRLRELAKSPDHEMAHSEADKVLLELIDDADVTEAYNALCRWCA